MNWRAGAMSIARMNPVFRGAGCPATLGPTWETCGAGTILADVAAA